METIFGSVNAHQLAIIAVVVIALVAVYFLVKNLIKLALIAILILIAVGTYFFLSAPQKSPADLFRAWKKVKGETARVVEKGKDTVKKGQEISKGVMEIMRKGEVDKGAKKD